MIPLLLGGAALLGAAMGVEGHREAKETNEEAERRLREAKALYNDAKDSLENAQRKVEPALLNFANSKNSVMNGSMETFIRLYEHIDVPDESRFKKINNKKNNNFVIDEAGVLRMRQLSSVYQSAFSGGAAGAATGALVSLAVSGSLPIVTGVMSVAGSALLAGEVGAAIGLAGTALSFGATMTPLAAIAAPVVFFSGISASIKADENLEKANTSYAEAEAAAEKMRASRTLCRGIVDRADMFDGLLHKLDGMFSTCVRSLDEVVCEHRGLQKTDKISAEYFSDGEFSLLAVTYSLAEAMRSVLEVPILNDDGKLTDESQNVYDLQNKAISEYNEQVDSAKIAAKFDKQRPLVIHSPKSISVNRNNEGKKISSKADLDSAGVMKITLDSSGLWPEAICRYAVYLFDEKSSSIEWHNLNADGISVDIDKFTHIIFCALQKESTNAWENVLFQTALIKLPQFAKAEFKLTGMDTNQGNKFVGKWVNIQSFVAETPKKEDKVMTFNSAGLWPEAICRYAAYFTDKNNSAHSAWRDVEADGKVVILEDGYTDVIFCGLPKNEKKNSFANAIFRTGNIELPKASGAVYKLTNVDVSDNNKYVGEWQNTNVAPPKKISTNITKGVYDNNDTVSESKSRFGKGLYGNNDVAPKSKSRFASGIYNNNEAYGAKVNTMVEKPKSSSGSLSNETYVPSRQLGKGLF